MASSKDPLPSSRSLTHRPSLSNVSGGAGPLNTTSLNIASRQSHARTGSHSHSHSIIGAALNSTHRVSRRKSMTSSAPNATAAMATLMQEAEVLPNGAVAIGARRSIPPKAGGSLGAFPKGTSAMAAALAMAGTGANGLMGSLPLPSPPASLPTRKFMTADGSAIEDDPNDMSDGEIDPTSLADANAIALEIARVRRASDGQPLQKDGRRGSRMELRCKKCGKGYKHSSCLTKHLWEHTPEWSLTSKLLISKHQQVQLLEAASVLVTMNHKATDGSDGGNAEALAAAAVSTPPDSARGFGSERDSASPSASTFSEQNDDRHSIETTPPPLYTEDGMKREPSAAFSPLPSTFSGVRSGFGGISRSYQSGLPAVDSANGFESAQQHGMARDHLRPPSSGRNRTGQEDTELAAAVDMLSCSFNSAAGENNIAVVGSVHGVGQDVPLVPSVPEEYLGESATPLGDTSFINSFPSHAPESFARGEGRRPSDVDDVKMEDSSDSLMGDDDEELQSRGRSDDDEDGVFGRMEE